MSKERILIIEDDKHISKLLVYNLEKSGYVCTIANDGEEALDILSKERPDLIILDIMLPKMDGFELCRAIKQDVNLKHIPIIMLTARGQEIDRVVGLELGADDYVVKPFSPREFLLRIRAVLKRYKPQTLTGDIFKIGGLFIDISKHKVTLQNKEIRLTPIEFKLLVTLVERRGRIQSREQLLSDIWDLHSDVYTRTVDTHIRRLRKKLGKMAGFIETIRGFGYRFKEEEPD